MTLALLTLVPLALLALVTSALLAALDAAHHAVSRSALAKELADRPASTRERVLVQHDDASRTLGALELGRVLAEVVVAVSLTALALLLMDSWILAVLLGAAVTAALMFLTATLVPRALGRLRPTAVLIRWRNVVRTVRALLGAMALALLRLVARPRATADADDPSGPAAQARRSVDRALENEHLHSSARDMIQGIFELGDSMVRELMVPRTDMVTVGADTPAHKAMRLFVRSGFSRIPVIGADVDDLRGVLYVKDLMRAIHSPWDPRPDRAVREIMRPARFIPESVAAGDVLRQMQSDNIHIAVMIDEYGGVAGIVTIEDVLEEIVGEIADEHDPAEPEIQDLGDGSFRVPARAGVSEVGDQFDLEIDDDDVDSAGGLLSKAVGKVPVVGDHGDIHGLHLVAEKTGGRRKRLSTLIVSRSAPTDEVVPPDHPADAHLTTDDPAAGHPAAGDQEEHHDHE